MDESDSEHSPEKKSFRLESALEGENYNPMFVLYDSSTKPHRIRFTFEARYDSNEKGYSLFMVSINKDEKVIGFSSGREGLGDLLHYCAFHESIKVGKLESVKTIEDLSSIKKSVPPWTGVLYHSKS